MTASPLSPQAKALIDAANEHEPLPSRAELHRVRLGVAQRVAMAGGAIAASVSGTAKAGLLSAGLSVRLLLFGLAGAGTGLGVLTVAVHLPTQPHAQRVSVPQTTGSSRAAFVDRALRGPSSEPSVSAVEKRSVEVAASAARSEPSTAPVAPTIDPAVRHEDARENLPHEQSLRNTKLAATNAPETPRAAGAAPDLLDAGSTPERRLARQLEVMQNVRSLLRAREPQGALELLDRHLDLFSRTTLEEEFRVARVLAMCQLGKRNEAQTATRAFFARWPGSPYRTQVEQACPNDDPMPRLRGARP